MGDRFLNSVATVAIGSGRRRGRCGAGVTDIGARSRRPETPWGEPDLQGLWTDETDTPFQRPARFANQEFFTEEQRAEFDRIRSQNRGRDERAARGSETDVAGAYNDEFGAMKRTGKRTSAIIDPPNGRIPPMTPEAQKIAVADRELRVALMQATQTANRLPDAPAANTIRPHTSARAASPLQYGAHARHDPRNGARWRPLSTIGVPRVRRRAAAEALDASCRRRAASRCTATSAGPGWQCNIAMDGESAFAVTSAVVRRLARRWEGKHAGDRRHQLQPEGGLSRLAREPACRRALDASSPTTLDYVATSRIRAWTRPLTVTQEFSSRTSRKPDLLRAALLGRQLRPPRRAAGVAPGRPGVCRRTRA
jgi:hypothetical protein